MPALRAIEPDDHGHDHDTDLVVEHPHYHDHDDFPRHGGRFGDILDAIGHTPLVEIPRMSPAPAVHIFAKLEMMNPTGSVKDRAAACSTRTRSSSSRRRAIRASPWP